MTRGTTASRQITEEVTSWRGVETAHGDWGAFCFIVGRHELGHLHGDTSAHFVFPRDVWAELRDQGRVEDHPMFPGKVGICARRIESEDDVVDVIALLRLNYDRFVATHDAPAPAAVS
jgi:luciferase-like monooxygenase